MDESKAIEKFLNKLIDYQNNQYESSLQEDELKRIASDMGLSDNDWQTIQKSFNDSILRARSYMQYENYDDAISEVQQALPLNPHNLDAVFLLATLHKKKWENKQNNDDKQKALDYANKCLQINPTWQNALQFISEIKRQDLKSPKKTGTSKILFIVVGIVALIGIGGFFMFSQDSAKKQDDKIVKNKELESSSANDIVFDKFDVPVIFKQNKKSEHVSIEIQNSDFKDYKNWYSYKLRTDIIAKGAEISSLTLRVKIIKQNGELLLSELVTTLYDDMPMARNGDIIPFRFFKLITNKQLPKISKVIFYIEEINENTDIPESYEAPKKVEFEWKNPRPANYNIEISERLTSYIPSFEPGKFFAKHVFEVKNTGNQPIETLKAEIVYYNKQNKEIARKLTFLNSILKSKIKRNQTRISSAISGSYANKDKISKYKIIVLKIE